MLMVQYIQGVGMERNSNTDTKSKNVWAAYIFEKKNI